MVTNDYGSVGTVTVARIATLPAYAPKLKVAKLPRPKPTHASSSPTPSARASVDDRVALIETCLERAKVYVSHNDPMQASEKLYKTTEEAIKFLAEHYKVSEVNEAMGQGRWWIKLLGRAAKSIDRATQKHDVDNAWVRALDIHSIGFHENAYSIEDIQPTIPFIEKLVASVQEVNNAR